MPTTEPLPRRSLKVETGSLKKFGDNVRARREAQDLSSPSTLSLSNGQEQLAERADLNLNQLASRGGLERQIYSLLSQLLPCQLLHEALRWSDQQ